ncbi:MAG: paraquat-inducible protein A [Phycisphaerales bacterium JB059]
MPATDATSLSACHACGLIQKLPQTPPNKRAICQRCRAPLSVDSPRRSASTVVALCLAALLLYPFAILLPVISIREMGHTNTSTVWSGMVSLFASGQILVGAVVLLGSVVAPLGKLGAMLTLCAGDLALHPRRQALTYRAVEWLGRWGMLDVLLVATLIAAVKLGDWVEVHPGPGVLAFTAVVVLSMLASTAFDPKAIWQDPAA